MGIDKLHDTYLGLYLWTFLRTPSSFKSEHRTRLFIGRLFVEFLLACQKQKRRRRLIVSFEFLF